MKRNINYIMGLCLSLISTFALTGCRDDESWNPYETPGEDGVISISLSVPEPVKVITRADAEDSENERIIEELAVLIYDGDGNRQQIALYPTDGTLTSDTSDPDYKTTFTLALNEDAKAIDDGDMNLVVVANANSLVKGDASNSLTNLQKITESTITSGKFVMSGSLEGTLSKGTNNEIVMHRTAAKFTGTIDAGEDTADFTSLDGLTVCNTASKGHVTAGIHNLVFTSGSVDSEESTGAIYTYPTKDNQAYIIVNGTYKGQPGNYYKVEMASVSKASDGTVTKTYLPIQANHWYLLHITKVTGPGFPSAALAAASPSSNIDWVIEDQVNTVLSMASDGIRELGVTREVKYEKGEMGNDTWTDPDGKNVNFSVRLYSHNSNEPGTISLDNTNTKDDQIVYNTTDGYDVTIKVTSGNDWLDISPVSSASQTGNDLRLLFNLGFRKTALSGVKEGEITVNWRGLERTVKVIWEQKFDASEICSVKLIMYPNGDKDSNGTSYASQYEIADYWKFIAGEGTQSAREYTSTGNAPRLWGIDRAANCDRIRNQGFHFPMPYGIDKKWTYKYEITFNETPTVKLKDGSNYSGSLNGKVLTLTTTLTDYTYDAGEKLKVKIDGIDYEFDLYHTGFFHFMDPSSLKDGSKSLIKDYGSADGNAGYYYYEVITTDKNDSKNVRYWLDRNLGAKACGLSILDASNNQIIASDKEEAPYTAASRGAYFQVANYGGDYTYASAHIYKQIAPPGYRLPSTVDFDLLRNSRNFKNGQIIINGVMFYNSCYDAGEVDLYFPKVKLQDGSVFSGEASSGYYWTKTDAFGLEKDEIGRWLQVLMLNGASNNYVNGNVQTYAMPVRCVSTENDKSPNKVTSFNVTGATHVYLMTTGGVGIFPWPGKAIGDAETMKTKTFNFTYTSAYESNELLVLFNYVDDKGRIYTFSANDYSDGNNNNDNSKHYNMAMKDVMGWPVYGTSNSDITANCSQVRASAGLTSENKTQKGTTWACKIPEEMKNYRLYWPTNVGSGWIHIWDTSAITKWDNNQGQNGMNSDVSGYYMIEFKENQIHSQSSKLGYLFQGNNNKYSKETIANLFTRDANGYYCAYITANETEKAFSGKPGGSAQTVKYYLTLGSSGEKEMTVSGSNWTLSSLTGSGNLQIYRKTNGTIDQYVTLNGSTFNTTGTEMNTKTQTSSVNVGNISDSGTYSFTYNPTANTLTITGGSGGGNEATYIILWNKSGRYGKITIKDASGNVLDNVNKANYWLDNYGYNNTQYYAYQWKTKYTGNVKFEFTNSSGTTAKPNPDNYYAVPLTKDLGRDDSIKGVLIESILEPDPRDVLNNSTSIEDGYRRVFWDNSSNNWEGDKKVYWWGGNNGLDWDQRKTMTQVPNSDKYWYYDIPNDCEGFKFEVGGNESGNKTGNDMWKSTNSKDKANTYSN